MLCYAQYSQILPYSDTDTTVNKTLWIKDAVQGHNISAVPKEKNSPY